MTPKEKAKELYDKAGNYIYASNAHFAEDDCEKNCALMVVDEVIKEHCHESEHKEPNAQDRWIKYWQNVRDELNAL